MGDVVEWLAWPFDPQAVPPFIVLVAGALVGAVGQRIYRWWQERRR